LVYYLKDLEGDKMAEITIVRLEQYLPDEPTGWAVGVYVK